jgi:hypothetical protein
MHFSRSCHGFHERREIKGRTQSNMNIHQIQAHCNSMSIWSFFNLFFLFERPRSQLVVRIYFMNVWSAWSAWDECEHCVKRVFFFHFSLKSMVLQVYRTFTLVPFVPGTLKYMTKCFDKWCVKFQRVLGVVGKNIPHGRCFLKYLKIWSRWIRFWANNQAYFLKALSVCISFLCMS